MSTPMKGLTMDQEARLDFFTHSSTVGFVLRPRLRSAPYRQLTMSYDFTRRVGAWRWTFTTPDGVMNGAGDSYPLPLLGAVLSPLGGDLAALRGGKLLRSHLLELAAMVETDRLAGKHWDETYYTLSARAEALSGIFTVTSS